MKKMYEAVSEARESWGYLLTALGGSLCGGIWGICTKSQAAGGVWCAGSLSSACVCLCVCKEGSLCTVWTTFSPLGSERECLLV